MDYDDYVNNSDDDHDNVDDNDDEINELVVAGCQAAVKYYINYIEIQPCRNFEETGYKWLIHCMTSKGKTCYHNFRMKPYVFFQLCNVLQHTYGLRHTRRIRLEESVAICLRILGHETCNRLVQDRFQHSGETIHRHFHKVLKCLNQMSMDVLKPSDPTFSVVPSHIQNNQLYWPHFKVHFIHSIIFFKFHEIIIRNIY
jgi:hypothetical protein